MSIRMSNILSFANILCVTFTLASFKADDRPVSLPFANQVKTDAAINWISFAELKNKYAAEPRPIIIDLYTSWCGWCKVMDRNTYSNLKVVSYINTKFYAVKYDAESREPVNFNGVDYVYNAANRVNGLSMFLTYGRLEFPHTILFSSPSAQPAPIGGYLKPGQLEAPIKFFGERADEKETFVQFNKKMKKEW